MSAETVDVGDIEAYHAEQVRSAVSTIVGAVLADRDLDGDAEEAPDPISVALDEVVRGCPVPKAKCRALLDQSADEPGTGIERVDPGEYEVDPQQSA